MLPVLRPVGGDEEVNAIRESIESGWWGKGPKVAQFEKDWSKGDTFEKCEKFMTDYKK